MNAASGRHRARRRWSRRASVGTIALGLASVAAGSAGLVDANAAAAPGSGLGSINISATATGLRVPFYSKSGEDVEAELPFALSQMDYGGAGHALTSVFWPGDTGGHGGDTLKLLTGSCLPPDPFGLVGIPVPIPVPNLPCVARIPPLPDQVYESLNDSYKAEAQSSTGNPIVTKSNPGVEMRAVAKMGDIEASTAMAGGQETPLGDTLGSTATVTSIKLTGPNTAVADAVSTMRDISLGGGAVTIDAVKSVAHAVTNGKTATGTGSTTVEGMKIAGVPVTLDSGGVHIDGQGTALPSLDALNSALANAGFKLYVANPTKTVDKAHVQLFSGQLVILQNNSQYTSNLNDTGTVITLGGTTIDADSSVAYVYKPPPLPSVSPPPVGHTGGSGGGVVRPPSTGSVAPPPPAVGPAPKVATQAPPAQQPVLAAQQTRLPVGIAAGWVIAALLGSGLVAVGLRRLPDQLFVDRGPACSLRGQT
jgi:hypothetical protein